MKPSNKKMKVLYQLLENATLRTFIHLWERAQNLTSRSPETQKPPLSGEHVPAYGSSQHMPHITLQRLRTQHCETSSRNIDVFEELGCLPGEYNLQLNSDVQPAKHTPSRIAGPLKAELKDHIEELVKRELLN